VQPTPRVTVLTPTYNRPDCLAQAVRSVVAQQYGDWEMLVINDGGQDVGDVVEAAADPRVSYLGLPENRGKAACLNLALRRARGEYVAYLDDDDLWYPDHLGTLVQALDDNPAAGAAYSDLYAVAFVRAEDGRRIPLEKRIWVCRDYNRLLMFHFNHVLHVSLMHRKELVLRAGGYDERVRVMIDWDLTRKLSFYADFVHVQKTTGEYYQPVHGSDRISDLGRADEEAYRQNLRRIRADLPPEPWPKVKRVAVVFPLDLGAGDALGVVRCLVDRLDYPCRIVLVNRDAGLSAADCRRALGPLGELGHLTVVGAPPCDLHEAYLCGVRAAEADLCYLPSEALDRQAELRLIRGLCRMERTGARAVRWHCDPAGPYDVLAEREAILSAPSPDGAADWLAAATVPEGWLPDELEADYLLCFARECEREGNYALARRLLERVGAVGQGGTGDPYLVQLYANVAFALGEHARAARMCRRLIEAGYGADNWVRLGCALQAQEQWREALDAYGRGLDGIGLTDDDIESGAFPLFCHADSDAFRAVLGQAECLLALGEDEAAVRRLRKASRLRANSHRAYVATGRLLSRRGRAADALAVLDLAARQERPAGDSSVEAAFAEAHERAGDPERAFEACLEGLKRRPDGEGLLETARRLGIALGRAEQLAAVCERFLEHRPGHVAALRGLAELYRGLGRHPEAEELCQRASVLSAAPEGSGR